LPYLNIHFTLAEIIKPTVMKPLFSTLLIFLILFSLGQSNYETGFASGYKAGYCYNDIGCVPPSIPVTPNPLVNESINSWQDGYNRGFGMGSRARGNNSGGNNSNGSFNQVVPPARWEAPESPDMMVQGAMDRESAIQQRRNNLQDYINYLNSVMYEMNKITLGALGDYDYYNQLVGYLNKQRDYFITNIKRCKSSSR
jgi:hypothetical protein